MWKTLILCTLVATGGIAELTSRPEPASAPRPDEGEWLPTQFRKLDWTELRKRGLRLTKDEFWHPEKGGVLSAAVQINGCSASFISKDGLLVTNHHCGFRAIERLSSVEQNYLENGFVSASREKELPARGMNVYIVRRIVDVSDQVHAARDEAGDDDVARAKAVAAAIAKITADAEASEDDVDCHVASYFEGREYHLIYRTRIQDVRLVYAPPRSVGEYGGEEDNWMWPRHTGDFCFFRAYVGKDGKPAAYAEDNVPFHPEHFLRVSGKGVDDGDLVMILGYPGSTQRYRSSVAVKARKEEFYPCRNATLSGIMENMEKASEGNPELTLRYSSTLKSLANVQKNALGMIHGLRRNRVVENKIRSEKEFMEWVAADPKRQKAYGSVLADLKALDEVENRYLCHDWVLRLSGNFSPLLRTMIDLCRTAEDLSKPMDERRLQLSDAARKRLAQRYASDRNVASLEELQKPNLRVLLGEALKLREDARLSGLAEAAPGAKTGEEVVEALFGSTKMTDGAARRALFEGGKKAVDASKDPLVILARGLAKDTDASNRRGLVQDGRRLLLGNLWIKAQQEWRGTTFYPDANSTLRVSVASVKGYEPRDGRWHVPHTTVAGIVAKERGEAPFKSPPALLKAAAEKNKGRFMDRELGDVPVCFLADGDTTGGNSGSCVINGRGELVGLNFDRVFENVAGDYGWNSERSRNVCVDFRYVLWIIEKVQPSPKLLKEMGF